MSSPDGELACNDASGHAGLHSLHAGASVTYWRPYAEEYVWERQPDKAKRKRA